MLKSEAQILVPSSRKALMEAALNPSHGEWHFRPILRAMLKSGIEWALIPQSAEAFTLNFTRPAIVTVFDAVNGISLGPTGFHADSLKVILDMVNCVHVYSVKPLERMYSDAVQAPAVLGEDSLVIETTEQHRDEWKAWLHTTRPGGEAKMFENGAQQEATGEPTEGSSSDIREHNPEPYYEPLPPLPFLETEISISKRANAEAAMRVLSGSDRETAKQGSATAVLGSEALYKFWMGLTPQERREVPTAVARGWWKIAEAVSRFNPDVNASCYPPTGPYDLGLDAMLSRPPLDRDDNEGWADAVRDAATFIAGWDRKAFSNGWSLNDIFGAPGVAGAGIAWVLRGRRVQSIGTDYARISSGVAIYSRRVHGEIDGPADLGSVQ